VDSTGNVLARYTQGKNVDEPLAQLRSGMTNYYEQDALGSFSSLSDGVGALANTYTYDSFGKLTASARLLTQGVVCLLPQSFTRLFIHSPILTERLMTSNESALGALGNRNRVKAFIVSLLLTASACAQCPKGGWGYSCAN
jgi:hypothetical protein